MLRENAIQEVRCTALSSVAREVTGMQAEIIIDGQTETLELFPHSVRSKNFRLLVQRKDGAVEEVPAAPPNTFRGWLKNRPDCTVSASIEHDQVSALIVMDTGEGWAVQPLDEAPDPNAEPLHVVYEVSDVLAGPWTCGSEDGAGPILPAIPAADAGADADAADVAFLADPGTRIAEIAFDADYEFYQANGSSESATMSDIENIVNGMNAIYEDEVNITHEITTIIVRSDSDDPYTSTASGTMLGEFRNHWNGNHGGIQRDIAHLMTGKNLDGTTIGVAHVGVVCSGGFGYGLSQSRFSGNLTRRIALTAHEVGHNWSAGHCNDSNDCSIMCSGLGGCTGNLTRFGATAENSISNHRDSRGCLGTVPEVPAPPTINNANGATQLTYNSARLNGTLVATGLNTTEVFLYWGDNNGGTTKNNWDNEVSFGPRTLGSISQNVTGLDENTTYHYRYYAINAEGETWATPTSSFATDSDPGPILESADGDGNSVTLQFSEAIDPVSGADLANYTIERIGGGSDALVVTNAVVNGDEVVVEFVGLEPGIHYAIRVSELFDTAADPNVIVPNPSMLAFRTTVKLIPVDAVWRYLDDGSNQSALWQAPLFDDSTWASGPAELGYGDGDEATVVGFGPDENNKQVTTYFRHAFWVNDPEGFVRLDARLHYDDGAVVYLNGVAVHHINLTNNLPNPVRFDQFTDSTETSDNRFENIDLEPALLVPGTNTIAVEIHQIDLNSSDISFSLELDGETGVGIDRYPPVLLSAEGAGNAVTLHFSEPLGPRGAVAENYMVERVDGRGAIAITNVVLSGVQVVLQHAGWDAGEHYRVIVSDVADNATTPNVMVPNPSARSFRSSQLIVATDAVWKYLDDGSDQGSAWKEPGFNDAAWASGVGELGYGDNDESTIVGFGPDEDNKHVTTYFRHPFLVSNPSGFTHVTARLHYDDGAVTWLNGQQINIISLSNPVGFDQFANGPTSDDRIEIIQIDPRDLLAGENMLAVEVHQKSGTSSDMSFSLQLTGDTAVEEDVVAPALLSAAGSDNGLVLQFSESLNAAATDPSHYRIEPLDGGAEVPVTGVVIDGRTVTLLHNGLPSGDNYRVVVIDVADTALIPNVIGPNPSSLSFGSTFQLVALDDVWRYLDDGSDQGAEWKEPGFDDGSWASGPAELGYGDDDEATVVGFGPNETNKYVTTYFRRSFRVDNPAGITALSAALRYDDGAVTYVNGSQVNIVNLTAPVTYDQLANNGTGDNRAEHFNIDPTLLVAGDNSIAVEIHQVDTNSSDISFALDLQGETGVVVDDVAPELLSASGVGDVVHLEFSEIIGSTGRVLEHYQIRPVGGGVERAILDVEVSDDQVMLHHEGLVNGVAYEVVAMNVTDVAIVPNLMIPNPSVLPFESSAQLVSPAALWRYLDDGSDQGTAWRTSGFDDSRWSMGPAELGYGDGDEATVVSFGPEETNKYITTYFRGTFQVGDPNNFAVLTAALRYDDGAAVYINGSVAHLANLTDPVTFDELASTGNGGDNRIDTFAIDPALLVAGENTVAVEIHQRTVGSSDISFSLDLDAQIAADVITPDIFFMGQPELVDGDIMLHFSGPGELYVQECTTLVQPSAPSAWTTLTNPPGPHLSPFNAGPPATVPRYFRIIRIAD